MTLVGFLFAAGCSQQSSLEVLNEDEDPIFRRARDLYARGMENEALENFLKLIQRRNGNAPESHLDAGNIYLKHLRDPVSAIYHFKHYEALLKRSDREDASERIELVQERIKAAKKEFAMTFDAKVYKDPLERLKLLDTIEALRSENEVLKRQLVSARNRLNDGASEQVAYEPPAESVPVRTLRADTSPRMETPRSEPVSQVEDSQRRYTIQAGDSLYKISRLVYGDGSRWREILNANRDVIPDESSLRVGATIRIP
ncbi:LysM peptidoglycan-binding domain-containing protein [Pelagicoccus sp. NFK12]|uniref:LysM peptidoglycan-binding domain-containing protein n=1 Tax=Pelagicoccus enzymogenes TaxID=2773457 RepID=A0A927FB31_9BACT|nr:LysM peptidoglycan-binding domain-containing protein [Pelagicoccus enzymogenes]MBD5781817.1 LysM peptidoglycan-binding domain-containing protein [Pelagicoccus enzymogenes]MDQ8196573.1 LysM peptidoglycan-binding domain-containing protein [Pelagicoccus enzymogenes]